VRIRDMAGVVLVGSSACLVAAVISASPAQAPTLDVCRPTCPVVTPTPVPATTYREGAARPLPGLDRSGPRPTLTP
jgi:hypothetical protein